MGKYGIIQGRLTIPSDGELQCFPENWEREFHYAKTLGLSFIEFFVERDFNPNNPLWSAEGRHKIISQSQKENINIYSACSDYIINNNIFLDGTIKHLYSFIDACSEIGCKLVVLPFFGKSDIASKDFSELVKIMKALGEHSKRKKILLAIETPFHPDDIIDLLENINMKDNVKCVFDTGNRALISESLSDEIKQLDKWIAHVHIKDKNKNDENVALGTGVVDFKEIFNTLSCINYNGPFVFETTRGKDPLRTSAYNMNFCDYFYNESY